MIIHSQLPERDKLTLPSGKLNVRFRQMRSHYQCFAGNKYLTLADGETAAEAISELRRLYDVPEGAEITVH